MNNEYYSLLLDIKDNKLLSKLEVTMMQDMKKLYFIHVFWGTKQ